MRKICVFALTLLAFAAASAQENSAGVIAPNEEKIAAVADGSIQEALASWWGFNPEDATASLQAALDSGVKVLRIDKQSVPWNVTPLTIPSNIEIVLDSGVTVQAKKGEFQALGASLMSIKNQENVVIRGGVDSVLLMRKSDYHQEPYKKSEWRHGISMTTAKNVLIEDLQIRSTGGDGIYVGVAGDKGAPSENITIRRVVCDDNNRQGISVISVKNLLIEGCVLSNTRGTAPAAGIDFEPNHADEYLVNCVMRDCIVENNAGVGIELWLGSLKGGIAEPISLRFENCVSRNNSHGYYEAFFHYDNKVIEGEVTLKNCLFAGNKGDAVYCQSKSPDAHAFTLENVTIDLTGVGSDRAPIRLVCPADSEKRPPIRRPIGGMVWDGVTVIAPDGRAPVVFTDDTGRGFGLFDITGTITVKQSADDPGETITVDEKWLSENFPGVREPKEE